MRVFFLVAIAAISVSLCGCGTPDNSAYRQYGGSNRQEKTVNLAVSADLSGSGSWIGSMIGRPQNAAFRIVNASGTVCEATVDLGDRNSTAATAPLRCTNGESGVLSLVSSAGGLDSTIILSSGAQGSVSYRQPSSTGPADYSPSYTPSSTYSPSYCGGSYYGATSCITGRPKTNHVRSYYRKDGTYVRSHWRS